MLAFNFAQHIEEIDLKSEGFLGILFHVQLMKVSHILLVFSSSVSQFLFSLRKYPVHS